VTRGRLAPQNTRIGTYCCLFEINRAMHYRTAYIHTVQSAVLRLHVVCPSVRLSVTLADQESHRLEILETNWERTNCAESRTVSPTPSLFVAQRPYTYSQGNLGNLGETRGGSEKVTCWSTKAAISLKRVKIEEKLLWRA